MNTPSRIFGMLVWLGGLIVAGAVLLMLTAARVGEHKSSTYGYAYVQFQNSWGGEIAIAPPTFGLWRTYTVSEYNKDSEKYEEVEKNEWIPFIPKSISIDAKIDYGEQDRDFLIFNAFEAKNTETYTIKNSTGYSGELWMKVTKPENANLMYDYRVSLPSAKDLVIQPRMDKEFRLLSKVEDGEQVDVVVNYTTKGMDVYKYNLSAYQDNVIESLQATIKLNTKDFEIYRFGLPHTTEVTASGSAISFNLQGFSTTQDLGVTFMSKQMGLDHIQRLLNYSPASLALFLLVVFMFSQIFAVRFNPFHYLFLGLIDLFYFLFVAYLIRFFGIGLTFGIAIALMVVMFFLYAPSVFGKFFAYRVVGVYLFLLTVMFSAIFLMPIFQGILFVVLIFLIFMSIMVFVARSDISKWPIVSG